MIIFLPSDALPEAIITPATTIKINEVIKITLTNIFVKLPIKVGKAPSHDTAISSPPGLTYAPEDSIQLPIKGIEVFNFTPQHTPGALQRVQVSSTFVIPEGQEQIPVTEFLLAH